MERSKKKKFNKFNYFVNFNLEMLGKRFLIRNLLKQSIQVLLIVSACASLCGVLLMYVAQRGIRYFSIETTGLAISYQLTQPNLENALQKRNKKLGSDFQHKHSISFSSKKALVENARLDSHTFHSPFVVEDLKEEEAREMDRYAALTNKSSGLNRTITFAVVWPCKGNATNCATYTRFPIETCRFNKCRQTWTLKKADVVVIYVYRIKKNEDFPMFIRPHHQRWVMLTPEAPARGIEFTMLDFPVLKGQFNWTQSYRLDSDIPRLYGQLVKIPEQDKNYDDIYKSKNVTAAWFVSHCITPSNRQTYVQRMQTFANIHIYGNCGNYTCVDRLSNRRALDREQCLPLLTKFYFFYLAFENSLCKDYVTEKFFKTFGNIDVIPVVRGGVDYKKYFPPGIFVDASDFKSPEDLARFLNELAKDKNRYISMLREKNKYKFLSKQRWFCDLCEKMMEVNKEKSYSDLRQWYVQDQCHKPNDM